VSPTHERIQATTSAPDRLGFTSHTKRPRAAARWKRKEPRDVRPAHRPMRPRITHPGEQVSTGHQRFSARREVGWQPSRAALARRRSAPHGVDQERSPKEDQNEEGGSTNASAKVHSGESPQQQSPSDAAASRAGEIPERDTETERTHRIGRAIGKNRWEVRTGRGRPGRTEGNLEGEQGPGRTGR
jgi:hypothetical protein